MSEFSLLPVDDVAGNVLELEVRNIVYSTYPASKFYRRKVNPTQALRTRRKKDLRSARQRRAHMLTWPVHILLHSSHVLVTAPVYRPSMPVQNSSGVAILVSLQECGFFQHITVHRTTTSRKPQVKIRLVFHFVERN